MLITGATRVVGLVGAPEQVARSVSPQIHNAAFKQLGLDWVYVTFGVDEDVEHAIRGLFSAGVVGVNVTMPHKVAAIGAVDHISADAKQIGAVNTIVHSERGLLGENTDGAGFLRYLSDDLGWQIEGRRLLVLGSGGAARSVVSACITSGALSVDVAGRELERASKLKEVAGGCPFAAHVLPVSDEVLGKVDLIVNATPLGQQGEHVPLNVSAVQPEVLVVDLVYSPEKTDLVDRARAAGIRAHGGLGMLLHQAAIAFELWTGRKPPLNTMSAAAISALGKL